MPWLPFHTLKLCVYGAVEKKCGIKTQSLLPLLGSIYFPAKKYFKESKQKIRFYEGKGCDVCHNTGFLGRIGIFEVLELSTNIKKMIVEKADADTLKTQAVKEGMKTMFDDGISKVINGLTTFDEIMRVTKL